MKVNHSGNILIFSLIVVLLVVLIFFIGSITKLDKFFYSLVDKIFLPEQEEESVLRPEFEKLLEEEGVFIEDEVSLDNEEIVVEDTEEFVENENVESSEEVVDNEDADNEEDLGVDIDSVLINEVEKNSLDDIIITVSPNFSGKFVSNEIFVSDMMNSSDKNCIVDFYPVSFYYPETLAVIRSSVEYLIDQNRLVYSDYFNPLSSNLSLEDIDVRESIAHIYMTGEIIFESDCHRTIFKEQINKISKQFPNIGSSVIYINSEVFIP